MKIFFPALPLAFACLVFASCATPPQPAHSPAAHPDKTHPGEAPPGFDASGEQPWSTFKPTSTDRMTYVGGQPSTEALDAFAASGGAVVINLKTQAEMAAYPGFQREVESRGLLYVHVPTAPEAISPESAERFRRAMEEVENIPGRRLVHCQASGRALYAVALDGVLTGELSGSEAKDWARARRHGTGWEQGERAIEALSRQKNATDP